MKILIKPDSSSVTVPESDYIICEELIYLI